MASENWIVLGDSLAEGMGFVRHSFASELVRIVRTQVEDGRVPSTAVSLVRLRAVGATNSNRFVRFGYAADIDEDPRTASRRVWIWNLASEGSTIESDHARLPLVEALRPSLAIVFRGSLESIVRPAALTTGNWPHWVPGKWRGYAAMDPRCYFSSTWWRRAKQQAEDAMKQRVRHALLRRDPGEALMSLESFEANAGRLLRSLRAIANRVVVCGLLPVSEARFPGSPARFRATSDHLRRMASDSGCEYLDWALDLVRYAERDGLERLFYRDGFHPNQEGYAVLAGALGEMVLFGQRQA